MNIVEVIREETRPFSDKTAVVEADRVITYAALLARVAALRDLLLARGVGAGRRIALRCRDGVDYIVGALAVLDCGAAMVPLADSLIESETQDTLRRIDVHGVLLHSGLEQPAENHAAARLDAAFFWLPRSASGTCDQRCREINAAFIRFSSGTTGASKGIVLSHRAIFERTNAANDGLAITPQDGILWVLGMSHHFVVSILLFLRQAATIVVANEDFPFSVVDTVQRHSITFIYASPVHYYLLATADAVTPAALVKVRLAISTAMKMPADICSQFYAKFGFAPREAYGIIEVGLPFINTDDGAGGRDSVGRILPAYQLRIDNPDADGIGDVLIRGGGMFDAYFSPWRTRAECLPDGWFHTGDLGRLDEQGRLCLRGRSKSVIISAGMKVFPEEVEEVINAFPGIRESLVFGRAHPQFGQVPVAQVVLAGTTPDPAVLLEDLRVHCCRRLSPYKVPQDFAIVPELPRTPSGKLSRVEVRQARY
jgi:long-chain acyl-CoA synthetase